MLNREQLRPSWCAFMHLQLYVHLMLLTVSSPIVLEFYICATDRLCLIFAGIINLKATLTKTEIWIRFLIINQRQILISNFFAFKIAIASKFENVCKPAAVSELDLEHA